LDKSSDHVVLLLNGEEEARGGSCRPLFFAIVCPTRPLQSAAGCGMYILLLLFSFIGKNHRKKERDLWPLISEPIF
jgi:hypothetical protein